MITVLPLRDASRKQALLAMVPLSGSEGQVLVMCDGSQELGFAVLDLHASVLRLHQLSLSQDDLDGMLADFLMRAAASYAANFVAYRIEIYDPVFLPFFRSRGFQGQGSCVARAMSEVVTVHPSAP